MTPMTDCRCDDLECVDAHASPYARGHFLLETVAPDALSATWICPATGWRWQETYFSTWRSDEPAARLDRLDRTSAQPAGRRNRIHLATRASRWLSSCAGRMHQPKPRHVAVQASRSREEGSP